MKRDIVVDGRGLEPPEPMERVLAALAAMREGERVRFLIHREPLPLYPILKQLGYRHQTHLLVNGDYEILIEQD